ncbi:hypothetical protein [Vibrio coralliilyticus]|uniref:hypothetical protein n=1 Tax=Vibrio coralliilyticus TaxID=190893 RepID=UPI001560E0B2|nr:hypothetical protein [Vibrio coralliilyticus]NRF60732.1 hypothetical protein [Vibrio coralliilyticus]
MLLDVLIQSVNEFQADCMKLCEKHYPTIHNKGMNEHHLSLAFSRRLSRTLTEFGHHCEYVALESHSNTEQPHHYRVTSDAGTVWILSSHLLSAGSNCRQKLFKAVTNWQEEYAFAIQPNDLLLLISDHWISRNKQSRELLHWWTGQLPDEIDQYKLQGISLYESESQLACSLEQHFGLSPYFVKFTHPLRRSTDQQLVRKYIQLYSVVQLS